MNDKELSINEKEISEKTRKLKAFWSPVSEEEIEFVLQNLNPEINLSPPDYNKPTIGFFNWEGIDPERVREEYPDYLSITEKQFVLSYMKNAEKLEGYMGKALSRMDGSFLGSYDMLTPDGKWVFPEKWDEHYVKNHNIAPPKNFILDAIEWVEKFILRKL